MNRESHCDGEVASSVAYNNSPLDAKARNLRVITTLKSIQNEFTIYHM